MTFYSYGSSYCWPFLVHVYSVNYWLDISVFWVIGVVSHVFFDVVWFSLAWPPTASSVGISVEIARSFLCGVPCCKHFFRHTVPYEVFRFSAPEAVIISAIIVVLARVCFLLLFLKELLYCCGEDFQLSCYFRFSIVTGLWLGHHEPCFIPFGCVYSCL